jgi:hypothetical protein
LSSVLPQEEKKNGMNARSNGRGRTHLGTGPKVLNDLGYPLDDVLPHGLLLGQRGWKSVRKGGRRRKQSRRELTEVIDEVDYLLMEPGGSPHRKVSRGGRRREAGL